MKFRVNGILINTESKLDDTITTIDKWYDRHTKLWVIQLKNKAGDQIGDAQYLPKKSAEIEYGRLKKEYNL